jgi:hypothetical protein
VIVTQEELFELVQLHVLAVVTPICPVPPPAPNDWLAGDMVLVHAAGTVFAISLEKVLSVWVASYAVAAK